MEYQQRHVQILFLFLALIRMNKVLTFLALFAFALSAAAPKEESFSVSSFFQGSWIIAKRVIDVNTGDVIGEPGAYAVQCHEDGRE